MKTKEFEVRYWPEKTGNDKFDYTAKTIQITAVSELEAKQKAIDELGKIMIIRVQEK